MTTAEFLSSLRERDVRLWVEDGKLKADAPPGALDEVARRELSARKQELMALITGAEATLGGPRSLVPLKPTGDYPPLFARPGHNGDVFAYLALAKHLDPRQPLYGVEPKGLDGGPLADTVEEMAAYEVEQIRSFQGEGPYHIAGYCAGGTIAFESARQLVQAGQQVARVMLFGAPFPEVYRTGRVGSQMDLLRDRVRRHAPGLTKGSLSDRMEYVRSSMRAHAERRDPALENRLRIEEATMEAVRHYEPGFYAGRVDAFLPSEAWRQSGERPDDWKQLAQEVVEHVGAGGADGDNMLHEPYVEELAALLSESLEHDSGDGHAAD